MLPDGCKVPVHRYAKVYWVRLQRSKDVNAEGMTVAATVAEAKAEAIALAPDEVQEIADKDDKDDKEDTDKPATETTEHGGAASSWEPTPGGLLEP
eukprot:214435-Amphidinium_carterae.1